jgi:GNAT superfamily N-acetyltransferase
MGRNVEFHNITISHKDLGRLSDAFVNAEHPEQGIIGQLHLGFKRSFGGRTVRNVFVKPEWQRKGIATAMWNYAVANGLTPQHSEAQTEDGKAWAAKVGD